MLETCYNTFFSPNGGGGRRGLDMQFTQGKRPVPAKLDIEQIQHTLEDQLPVEGGDTIEVVIRSSVGLVESSLRWTVVRRPEG